MNESQPLLTEVITQGNDISDDDSINECYICKEPMTANEYKHYCDCEGYISWVHNECLNTWLNTSQRTECEFCENEYRYEYIINWSTFLTQLQTTATLLFIFIITILICSLFPNHIIYAEGYIQKIIMVCFLIYVLVQGKKYLSVVYMKSKILTVLPLE